MLFLKGQTLILRLVLYGNIVLLIFGTLYLKNVGFYVGKSLYVCCRSFSDVTAFQ